jgi:hypothetical protein
MLPFQLGFAFFIHKKYIIYSALRFGASSFDGAELWGRLIL